MGIKIFYFIRGGKIFFYVVKFFLEKLKFFPFLSKIGATYSYETLGFSWNLKVRGGLWSNKNNFDDVHCYEILTQALVAMDPKKSSRGAIFWQFFWSLCNKTFYGEQFFFYTFCYANRPKVLFFAISQKKIGNSTFRKILHNKMSPFWALFITKFCQDAKKTILVKVWPLIKSLLTVCHSTADPKSLNFISKCIFMDSDRSVSAQMGFSKQIMALANKSFIFGWYQPTMAAIGRSAANFCSSRLFLIFFKYFKVR